jgi:hypothetical protein
MGPLYTAGAGEPSKKGRERVGTTPGNAAYERDYYRAFRV